MEPIHDHDHKDDLWHEPAPASTTGWLVLACVLFFAAAIFGGVYIYQQSTATSNLAMQNQSLRSTMDLMGRQIGTLSAKLDQMSAPPPATDTSATATAKPGPSGTGRTSPNHSGAQDRRVKHIQSQLAQQQKLLKETQDQIASAKSDLEGKLGSTRDELNGSIARTHDELVTLEKRGERSFYEFDLSKSKDFQREGPIRISLRKADSKHQSYDLMMLVDDHQLSKKKVDLYEPIWLHQTNQPVQVVVNKIDKDHIHGYVSAPKYTEAELTSSAAQPSTETNTKSIPGSSPAPSSYSTPTTSSTPANSSQRQN
jgi:hypothetical protein